MDQSKLSLSPRLRPLFRGLTIEKDSGAFAPGTGFSGHYHSGRNYEAQPVFSRVCVCPFDEPRNAASDQRVRER